MEKFKIGQEITMMKDFEIESGLGKVKTLVRKGDKGFIDSNGFVNYTTGDANGKIQRMAFDFKLEDYDTENIAKMILNRLDWRFNIREYLCDYEIEQDDFESEIADLLIEIL